MPVERKGFLFNHFEKIACGVVGLGLILALLYMSARTSGDRTVTLIDRIKKAINQLETDMNNPPPPSIVTDYVVLWEEASRIPEPGEMRDPWNPPWPVYYDTVFVGPGKDSVLRFKEPLAPNSVRVDKEEPRGGVVAKLEHPVGMDYSQVRIGTSGEGKARVVGVSERTPHIQPVVVDARAGRRAAPPLALKLTRGLSGITVTFLPNPENEYKVVVQGYEVFRKRARDVDAEFRRVYQLPVQDFELTEQAKQLLKEIRAEGKAAPVTTERPAVVPGSRGVPPSWYRPGMGMPPAGAVPTPAVAAPERPGEEAKEAAYTLQDADNLLSGETYLYKVRTVAYLSYPKESEFTEPQSVVTVPARDFRFMGMAGGKVRFEVAVYEGGYLRRKEFRNAVGDEIGGFDEDRSTGRLESFLTGCYLVDYHRSVRSKEKTGFRDRIIFVNQRGELDARWRDEPAAPELFGTGVGEVVRPTGVPTSTGGRPRWTAEDFINPQRRR